MWIIRVFRYVFVIECKFENMLRSVFAQQEKKVYIYRKYLKNMPVNKNALIRYKTIDNCLSNHFRRWKLEDLVEACSDALYEMEGITKGVSVRTVQGDIQMMRSDKLGYNAPIEVYDQKYYRYADRDYSITNTTMTQHDCQVLREAVDMRRHLSNFSEFAEISDVIGRLQDKLAMRTSNGKPIIHQDSVPLLRGLHWINQLYDYINRKQTIKVMYKSFSATKPTEYIFYPYLLKEFRNRWFVFGSQAGNMLLYNFPLDRIENIEPVNEPYRENEKFDSESFFNDVIGVSKNINDRPRFVKFRATAKQSNYVKTKPLHSSQKLLSTNPEDGSCIFSIEVVLNIEMYSVFLSYGTGLEIISPRIARNYMKKVLQESVQMYNK